MISIAVHRRARVLLLVAVALSASACHHQLQLAVVGDTAIVHGVHNVVVAEKAAYEAKAIDRERHRAYLLKLQTVIDGERALNTALLAWAKDTDKGAPEQVKITSAALGDILNDLGDTWTPGSAIGNLVSTLHAALNLLVPTQLPGQ